jgi:lysophospholipase L1-like esterase
MPGSHRPLGLPMVAALVTSLLLPTLLAQVGSAEGATRRMVALGDSYASGVGTRSYEQDSGSCLRSPYAYPVLDAARVGATLSFRACSGATSSKVRDTQLGTLSAGTTYVSITVGGNDAGFASVLTECAQPWWSSDCNGAIDAAQSIVRTKLPSRLDGLYRAVRVRAPSARVVVVGYPRLFNGEDCNAGTFFSPAEETRLNHTAALLDTTIADRASAHGFSFVDPRHAFTGHAICDQTEWINGLSSPVRESFHPNRTGQRHYADLVDNRLG